jgi:DNA-binding CsgD family transcriptional regulator
MTMVENESLRPLERRVLRLVRDGVDDTEIARRFRHSPEFVKRVIVYAGMPRAGATPEAGALRPVERRILKWRAGGTDHAEIARRFRRSSGHIERIEQLATYKLGAG